MPSKSENNSYPILVFPGFSSSCIWIEFRLEDIRTATGSKVICLDSTPFEFKETFNPFSILTNMETQSKILCRKV